jgi:hypothetical protein
VRAFRTQSPPDSRRWGAYVAVVENAVPHRRQGDIAEAAKDDISIVAVDAIDDDDAKQDAAPL